MPVVKVRDNENPDAILRRFRRACEKAGTITELRRRERHEKPTTTRKRAKAAARKRWLKKALRDDPRAMRKLEKEKGRSNNSTKVAGRPGSAVGRSRPSRD